MTGQPQRRLAVLGSPIAHSLSPVLHRAAEQQLGLLWHYDRAEVGSGELAAFLAGLDEQWLGLSLTMPLKREVLPLLDTATPLVTELGVANTVRFDAVEGTRRLSGANTDVWGIVQALREAAVHHADQAVVLGAGATALSAVRALAELGVQRVHVLARHPERASQLIDQAAGFAVEVSAHPLADEVRIDAPVLVSTLPPRAADHLTVTADAPVATLLDVAYDPWPSRLARTWAAQGHVVVSGLEMLLWQAVAQNRFWLNDDETEPLPDEAQVVAAMRQALAEAGHVSGGVGR
ncbi:shikimate dehydrogenase [Pseudoclavibacter soli]|uniref:shikimate dehydrogenase n=1 Tax=Pseudoclavibacter soli TaxID=452623 RepID=UPI00040ECE9A|nr:shikimate dehydrogenase [Pseudoclavibacter soli]